MGNAEYMGTVNHKPLKAQRPNKKIVKIRNF